MSAFIVSDKHIHAMLNSINKDGGYSHTIRLSNGETFSRHDSIDLSKLGQILVDQNYRSVNHRYNETGVPPVYEYQPLPWVEYEPVQIIKACHCYDYQACENPDYPSTLAHEILRMIESANINRLPGYDAAAWEIR